MSWNGLSADSVWHTCFDCTPTRNFREADYKHHLKTAHRERPEEEALTVQEVAEALKVDRREINRVIKSGELRSFWVERGFWPKRWVRRKDLKAYVRREVAAHPEKAVSWAATGAL